MTARKQVSNLTERQQFILLWLASGYPRKRIQGLLNRGKSWVDYEAARIYRVLGVVNGDRDPLPLAVAIALRGGLVK